MTKRVKLLSVMVAAVLCFVAGFALLFGSNKTAKAAEVPVVEAPAVSNTYVATGAFDFKSTVPTDSEWIFTEMTLSAKTTATRHATDPNGFISTLSTDGTVTHTSAEGVYNGILHNSEPLGVESFKLLFNANGEEKQIKIAVNTVTGEMTTIVNGDVEHATSAVKYGSAASLTGTDRYFGFTTNSASVNGVIKNLVMYDGEGKDLVATSTKMTKAANVELPATAVAPNSGVNYAAGGSYNFKNTRPSSDNYVIYDYVIAGSTTYTGPQNGLFTKISDGSKEASVLHSFQSTPNVQTVSKMFFGANNSEDTHVKVVANLSTGDLSICKDDVWTVYTGMYDVSSLTNPAYYLMVSNGCQINGIIKNFVCYDGLGNDLGITTNLVVDYTEELTIDTSNVASANYSGSGTKTLYNAKPTNSKWIIFEWTNGENNDVVAGGGHMFSYGLGSSKQSTELVSVTDRTQLLMNEGTTKVAFNTQTGDILRSFNGSLWTKNNDGLVNKDGETGPFYAGILWNNNNVTFAEMFNLKCYDGEGNDLGVDTNFARVLDIPESAPAVDNKYYANDAFNFVNATATSAQYIIFEYTLKAGIGVTDGGSAPQNGLISTLSNNGTVTNENIAGSADGFLYQYGSTPSVFTTYEWFISAANDTAVKIVIDTKDGSIYVSKNGGAFDVFAVHTEAATLTGTDRYFGITTNAPGGKAITGYVEDLVCYDSNGVNLGVKTKGNFGEVVEGKVEYATLTGHSGFHRYQGNVYFKDTNGGEIAAFSLGNVSALKYGEEATTLKFITGGGALQLFYPGDNGKPSDWNNTWDDYNNEWYVVEAGTLVGGKVILAEDMIIRIHGSEMQLFNASHEFAINYAGLPEGAVNANPTSYTFFSNEIVFEAPSAEGATFYGWNKTSIPQYSIGDVTVTASWYSINSDYNIALTDSIAVNFVVNAVGYTGLYAEATMIYDGENAITKAGAFAGTFTFDGILPQHLADEIHFVVTNGEGGEVLIDTTVSVKGYLDLVIAAESIEDYSAEKLVAFKAIAEDLLYYGAAAQLYTGHDVENLPADLSGATDTIGAIDNVKAKEGEKDASYYWSQAALVYADTVKLYFKIAAPADSSALKVVIVNGEEQVVVTEFTAVEGSAPAEGLCYYEFTVSVAITEFDSVLTLNIYEGEEVKGQTLTYSVNSYVAEIVATEGISEDYLTLLERVWCYGASAKAFTEIA